MKSRVDAEHSVEGSTRERENTGIGLYPGDRVVISWADRIADLKLPRIVAQANNIHAIGFGIDTINQTSEPTSDV